MRGHGMSDVPPAAQVVAELESGVQRIKRCIRDVTMLYPTMLEHKKLFAYFV
jgi:hypothetical protein